MAKARIRKDDTVIVIAGKEKGKTGKVLRVIPEKSRVIVERLNIVKRHSKSRGQQGPQGIVEKEAPIHISNVMIFSDNSPSRVGAKILEDGRKVRIAKRSGEQLDN